MQLGENSGQWFYPRVNGTASISVMHSYASSANVSPARLEGMQVFGALVALFLALGVPPLPLSSSVLQWIIHDCNIHSLHKAFVSEWHPELSETIKDWLDVGPQGSISQFQGHFNTWHDTQVC